MKLVVIESPYKGNWFKRWLNIRYARACMRDSLNRGEFPLLSHLLYPQVLDDNIPEERKLGIEAGLAWAEKAELTAVYIDRGVSSGVEAAIDRARKAGRAFEFRTLTHSPRFRSF